MKAVSFENHFSKKTCFCRKIEQMDLSFISDLNMDDLYIAFIINNHDTGDDNDDL